MRRIILNRKYIAKLATRWTTGIFAFLGLIGTFASLSDLLDSSLPIQCRIGISIGILAGIWVISFLLCAVYTYRRRRIEVAELNNGHHIYVQYGDVFSETEVLEPQKRRNIVIPVNRCFDTLVDNDLVSASTLHLFESRNEVEDEVPKSFSDVEKKYRDIQKSNNENDIEAKKQESIRKIRCHYVKQLIDEFDYFSKKAEADTLLIEMNQREKEFDDEKSKIDGHGGLKDSITNILAEITDLQNQTKNESILADNINKKLLHMVSFKLEHFEDSESKGFYKVKDCNTNAIRDITELSTGEKNVIAFLYFLEKLDEVKETPVNKPRIIVFDDPMNSNDDGMQYLIIEELQTLMKKLLETDHFILLTHNKHFYINVRYNHKYNKDKFIRFHSNGTKTQIITLVKDEDDFKTSYESLWIELKLLYEYDVTSADMLLNPIRRIIETFTKFNALDKTNFCNEVSGAKKLFDVNSHSIDDIEAELNGKTKQEVIQMFYDCFAKNDYGNHFLKYWKNVSIDETGKLVMEN